MARKIITMLCALAVTGMLFPAATDKAKAEAIVKKAVAFYQANGEAKAVAAFHDKKGQFVDGDYYVFMYNFTGVCLAHGMLNEKVGKNWIEQKDIDGKLYILDIVKTAKSDKGGGLWTPTYKNRVPTTKAIQTKTSFVMKVPGKDVLIGCGIFLADAK
ncbi:MAG: cache domain-containing protein [Spirochaetota bacterium]